MLINFYENEKIINKSEEWFLFEKQVYICCANKKSTHIKSTLLWFGYTLLECYKTLSLIFFTKKTFDINENIMFASKLSFLALNRFQWKNKSTIWRYFAIMKQFMFSLNNINTDFITTLKLKLSESNKKIIYSYKNELKYPCLKNWVFILRNSTCNKSDLSLKNIILFLLSACKNLKIILTDDVSELKTRILIILAEIDFKILCEIFKAKNYVKKIQWFKYFLEYIVELPVHQINEIFPEKNLLENLKLQFKIKAIQANIILNPSDVHKISYKDLDKIYEQASKTKKEELFFLLLITTGMRVTALTNIELYHICSIDKEIQIFTEGKTIEKGSKWFSFSIIPYVQILLLEYITKLRPSLPSKYLFPGRTKNEKMSSISIQKMFYNWCRNANLKGKEFHIHSLRHNYAYLLLQSGNSLEMVSKCLGHSNVSTTTNYYLKESTMDVLKRSNVPWIKQTQNIDTTPLFLKKIVYQNEANKEMDLKTKKQKLNDITMFFD